MARSKTAETPEKVSELVNSLFALDLHGACKPDVLAAKIQEKKFTPSEIEQAKEEMVKELTVAANRGGPQSKALLLSNASAWSKAFDSEIEKLRRSRGQHPATAIADIAEQRRLRNKDIQPPER